MNYVLKNQLIRLCYFFIPSAETRSRLLKKNHFFAEMGDNVHFQPRILPADPKFIKFHNNIAVASNVGFITHDIIHKVLNNLPGKMQGEYKSHLGCIEILDNVFIGSGTRIMPNVRIGPNVIIAAGSIITHDVPEGVIVAGVPTKIVGKFSDILERRKNESLAINIAERELRVEEEWKKFYFLRK